MHAPARLVVQSVLAANLVLRSFGFNIRQLFCKEIPCGHMVFEWCRAEGQRRAQVLHVMGLLKLSHATATSIGAIQHSPCTVRSSVFTAVQVM